MATASSAVPGDGAMDATRVTVTAVAHGSSTASASSSQREGAPAAGAAPAVATAAENGADTVHAARPRGTDESELGAVPTAPAADPIAAQHAPQLDPPLPLSPDATAASQTPADTQNASMVSPVLADGGHAAVASGTGATAAAASPMVIADAVRNQRGDQGHGTESERPGADAAAQLTSGVIELLMRSASHVVSTAPQAVQMSDTESTISSSPAQASQPTEGGACQKVGASYVCFRCNLPCDPWKSRLQSKQKQAWLCSKCNSKCTLMNRAGITLNAIENLTLSKEQKIEFWRSAARGQAAIKELFHRAVKQAEVVEELTENGGAFLPLAAWAAKGYDCDAIKNLSTPENIQHHPVLGTCYRVVIYAKKDMKRIISSEEAVRTYGGSTDYKRRRVQKAASAADGGEDFEAAMLERSDDELSEPDTLEAMRQSAEAAAEKAAAKKQAVAAKAKAMAANQRQEAMNAKKESAALARAAIKQAASRLSLAKSATGKINGPLTSLQAQKAKAVYSQVQPAFREKVETMINTLTATDIAARRCVALQGNSDLPITDSKDRGSHHDLRTSWSNVSS